MNALFNANVGLHNWSAPPRAPLTVNASLTNADVADVMALAGQSSDGYSGALTANATIGGTVANPRGTAMLQVVKGKLYNEPFDRIVGTVNLADQLVTVPSLHIQTPGGPIDLTAEFRHPRDSFTTGNLHTHLNADLSDLRPFLDIKTSQPVAAGSLKIDADAAGTLQPSDFLLTSVNADIASRAVRWRNEHLGDFTAMARTSGQTLTYNVTSNFAGSNIRMNGNTQLTRDYQTTADASIANLPVERVLAVAGQTNIPARGILAGSAHFSGTVANPAGNVDVDLTHAVLYNEPLDRVHAQVTYLPQSVDIPAFEVAAGPSRIDLTARYDHPAGNFERGNVRFNVTSSHIDLNRIHNIQTLRPGLGEHWISVPTARAL